MTRNHPHPWLAALALCGALAWTPAAQADNLNPVIAGGLGAMAGVLIGQSMGGHDGAVVGGAIGAVAGVALGNEGAHREGYRYGPPPPPPWMGPPARTIIYEPVYRVPPPYRAWREERFERRWEHRHEHREHRRWERDDD